MAVPTINFDVGNQLVQHCRHLFCGTNKHTATAAVGIVFSVMFFIQSFGFFFGHGSGNYISRELGAKRHNNAVRMASNGFFFSFAFGIVIYDYRAT